MGKNNTIKIESKKNLEDFRFTVQGSRFTIQGFGYRVPRSVFRVPRSAFRAPCSVFRVPRSRFQVSFRNKGDGVICIRKKLKHNGIM